MLGVQRNMVNAMIAAAMGQAQGSVFLRMAAPPETKAEYRTTIAVADETGGTLEAAFFTGCRILSNVRSSYRCRIFIASSRVAATGSLRSRAEPLRRLQGWTADFNRSSLNETASMWRSGRKISVHPLDGLCDIVYPASPVAVGSTWAGVQHWDGQPVRIEYELVSFGQEGQGRTAWIRGELAPGQPIAMVEPFEYVVDVETGLLRRCRGKYSLAIGPTTLTTAFRTVRSSLVVPPPRVMNRQPAKKPARKPAKPPVRRPPSSSPSR